MSKNTLKLKNMDNFHVLEIKQSDFTVTRFPFIQRSDTTFSLELLKKYGVKVVKKIPVVSSQGRTGDLYLYTQSSMMRICRYEQGNNIKLTFGVFDDFIVFEKSTAKLGQFLLNKLVHSLRNTLPKPIAKTPKNLIDMFKEFLDEEYVNEHTKTQIITALTPFISTYKKRKAFGLNMCLSIVFTGEPGDGKTFLATKIKNWIAHYLGINHVEEEATTFQKAAKLAANFVAVIDDMNVAHFRRDQGAGEICQNILSEMDRPLCNRLFLLTTNEVVTEKNIDRAFFRPGRIQNIVAFKRPNENLKNRIIDDVVKRLTEAKIPIDADFIIGVKMFANESELSLAEVIRLKNLIMTDIILECGLSHPKVYINKCKSLKSTGVEHDDAITV